MTKCWFKHSHRPPCEFIYFVRQLGSSQGHHRSWAQTGRGGVHGVAGGEPGLMIHRLTSHSQTISARRRPPIYEWSDSFRRFHVTGLIAVSLRWQTTLRGFSLATWVQVEGKDLGQSTAKWQIQKQNMVLPLPPSIHLHVTRHVGWNSFSISFGCIPASCQMSISLRAQREGFEKGRQNQGSD